MQIAFALPDRADTGGGNGFDYADGLTGALRSMGHAAAVLEGDDPDFPLGVVPLIDGLLLTELLPRLNELADRGAVALVHHAFARAGRDQASRARVGDALRTMLPRLRVVATSQPVADRLVDDFGLADVSVVAPGARDLPRSIPGEPCHVLSVGVLTPRKGHDVLLRAMARLVDVDWSLTIAGAATRDPVHAAHLAAMIPELGLTNRVRLMADPSDAAIDGLWNEAQLFALATRWEGHAAGVAEALRRGIPVVTTTGGGALVPLDAGAVCSLDDLPTLEKCLRRVLFDPVLRADMAEAAWQAGQALPSWPTQAAQLLDVLTRPALGRAVLASPLLATQASEG